MKLHQDSQIVALDSSNPNELSTYNPQMNNMGNYSAPTPSVTEKETDVRDLFGAFTRRKWLIMSLAAIMATLALVYSLAMTPIYRASGVIKIDAESKAILDYGVEKATTTRLTNEEFMRTQYKILQSRQLARRVIDTLALEETLMPKEDPNAEKPFYADIIQNLKNEIKSAASSTAGNKPPASTEETVIPPEVIFLESLRIQPGGKSQLVGISYDSQDPKLASSVVNSLIDNFINMTLDSRVAAADHAKVFLSEQLVKAKANLEQSESKLVRYEKEKGIVNTGRPGALISDSLEQLNQAYVRAKRDRINAEAELSQGGGASSGNVRILDNVVIQNLKAELQRLKSKYQENAQIYRPAYPLMREIQGQIKQTESTLARELSNIKRSVGQDTKTKFSAALEKERELSKELNKAKGILMSSRDKSLGHNTLLREVQSNREIYEGLRQRMKEVNIAGHVGTNNITKIDSAFTPFNKHSPNTKLNIGLGLIFGLLLGSLIALLLEKMDERIKSVEDLKKLSNLPVLGIFPNTKVKGKQAVLIAKNPGSAMAEAFRSLRTNMLFSTPEGVPKILHLTSSGPSEGKSNTGINLASVFAQTGKSVLMIDADLRKPSLHKYLQLENVMGLSDYLSGDLDLSEVEGQTDIDGLTVITAGSVPESPADFLSSNEMVELLQLVSDKYDLILIDSPPVMGLADALILSNRSSATLFIVSSHEAKKSHVLGALDRLKMGYGNVIGFVLTKAREGKKSGYGYDYDYGDSSWGNKSKHSAPKLELKHNKNKQIV